MEGGNIVDDYHEEFEDVDGDERAVCVVGFELSVRCLTSLGKSMCHQKPSSME